MDALQRLKNKLNAREKISSSMLSQLFFTGLPGLYKSAGMDFILFDLEHGSYHPENVGDLLFACRKADLPSVVRVTDHPYHCISKALDMGADGILLPRTETVQQVENALKAMRFYPKGVKGAGGRGLLRAGESAEDFNRNRLFFPQIESPAGVENLGEMLSRFREEIAGILIGPYDLALTSGCGFDTQNDIVLGHIRTIIDICREYRVSVGMYMEPDEIEKWHREGMNLFWVTTETGLLANSMRGILRQIQSLQ